MDERTRIDVIDGVNGITPDFLRAERKPWPAPDPATRLQMAGRPGYRWQAYAIGPYQVFKTGPYFQDPMHE